jgi:hypothetical protein
MEFAAVEGPLLADEVDLRDTPGHPEATRHESDTGGVARENGYLSAGWHTGWRGTRVRTKPIYGIGIGTCRGRQNNS